VLALIVGAAIVPVNVGDARGAYDARVVARLVDVI
jgi:hypothetical protein